MDSAEALHRPRISMSLLERKTPPLEEKSFQLTTHACSSDEEIRRHGLEALPGLADRSRVGARARHRRERHRVGDQLLRVEGLDRPGGAAVVRESHQHGVPGHRVLGSDPIEASLRSLAAVSVWTLWTSSRHFLLALLLWMLITSTRVSSFHLRFGVFHVPEATLIIKDPRSRDPRASPEFSLVVDTGGEAGIIGYMAEAYDIAIGGTTGIVVPHGLFLNATPLGKVTRIAGILSHGLHESSFFSQMSRTNNIKSMEICSVYNETTDRLNGTMQFKGGAFDTKRLQRINITNYVTATKQSRIPLSKTFLGLFIKRQKITQLLTMTKM
ncbi:hypothetical protein SELMODRAFT_426485 [Selaginella moellendorffii]|uniref:Uncharacterized protein n=1 Tax=Selaginella moellendorffii TaxID=88036 RepID=D8SWI4_SELML|nr:hypothetical protein SELMODRAFT_426485 [Selaginella moellendorffii]